MMNAKWIKADEIWMLVQVEDEKALADIFGNGSDCNE